MCKWDMQTVGLREGDAGDRAYWKETINNQRRPQMTGKARGKEDCIMYVHDLIIVDQYLDMFPVLSLLASHL